MAKQIMIDGVDVSWCKHYKHNDKNSGWSSCTSKDEEHIHAVNPLCCEKKDCLYKQLKRKEKECEALKKKKDENETFYLKKYANKDSDCLELQHKVNILKQTLTEIKEIATENFYFLDCDYRWILDKILQKISECEVYNAENTDNS